MTKKWTALYHYILKVYVIKYERINRLPLGGVRNIEANRRFCLDTLPAPSAGGSYLFLLNTECKANSTCLRMLFPANIGIVLPPNIGFGFYIYGVPVI